MKSMPRIGIELSLQMCKARPRKHFGPHSGNFSFAAEVRKNNLNEYIFEPNKISLMNSRFVMKE